MAVFTNQATLSYGDNTVNSNIVTGNIVEVLSATKTAVVDSYTSGDDITYVVSITNSGAVAISGVEVVDNLGAYTFGTQTLTPLQYIEGTLLYYQNGILQPTPTTVSGPPLTVSGITVPAGGNAILVYETSVTEFAPITAGGTVTNEIVVTAPGITTPIVAEETINATEDAFLSITKALSPTNVTENSDLTYTFTIQNTGNSEADATDNVTVTDTFNPILSDITVTLNGAPLSPTLYTYDETTGLFQTAPGAIVVPAATISQNPDTGAYIITPGTVVLTVTGTV